MLRITKVESQDWPGPTIKLEGKLLAAWTTELRAACQQAAIQHSPPRVDLSAVTFVDSPGLDLLGELAAAGTELVNLSPFVAALLKREAQP